MNWTTNQLRSMCVLTNLTGVLSEHNNQYHELHCTDMHFLDFGLRSRFAVFEPGRDFATMSRFLMECRTTSSR